MKKVLVCGSIAFDNIMDFPGLFGEQIIPEKIHSLNVSFLVNSMKRVRGGTAPNIAYNLALVGERPVVLGTVGKDFEEYRQWLEKSRVETGLIRVAEDDFTSSCYITTDQAGNQITVFYPGAMARDAEISLKDLNLGEIGLAIIAPTEPSAMVKWAAECRDLGLPYLFDPGMQIPRLSAGDLAMGILGARIVVLNEYEYEMMHEKTGLDAAEILKNAQLIVVTLGEKGSMLRTKNQEVHVPACKPCRVADPTGAGDAYRAGLIKGYFENAELLTIGRYASVSAVYAVEFKGPTEHKYTPEDFQARYINNYGGQEEL